MSGMLDLPMEVNWQHLTSETRNLNVICLVFVYNYGSSLAFISLLKGMRKSMNPFSSTSGESLPSYTSAVRMDLPEPMPRRETFFSISFSIEVSMRLHRLTSMTYTDFGV